VARDSGRLSILVFRQFGISEPKWLSSVSRNRTTAANSLYLLEATIRSVRLSRHTDIIGEPAVKSQRGVIERVSSLRKRSTRDRSGSSFAEYSAKLSPTLLRTSEIICFT
jgi:hypothetical protein